MNNIKLSAPILLLLAFSCNSINSLAQNKDESDKIIIAGYQMIVLNDINSNKEKILAGMHKAAAEGTDFLVTPEGSLSGYTSNFDQGQVQNALTEIESAARELHIGLMLGTCFKEVAAGTEYCYNQVRVYDPDGRYLGAYSKILRCSPLDFPGTGEMLDYVEGELKTFEWKGKTFGILICNDMWATPGYTTMPNPYLPWKLEQMGAKFIVHCINSGYDQKYKPFHESSAELWAYSLKIPIIEINASYGEKPVNARSGLIDAKGERTVVVPDTSEHLFIIPIKRTYPEQSLKYFEKP